MKSERRWTLLRPGGLCALFVVAQLQFLDDAYHWDALYYVTASARDIFDLLWVFSPADLREERFAPLAENRARRRHSRHALSIAPRFRPRWSQPMLAAVLMA